VGTHRSWKAVGAIVILSLSEENQKLHEENRALRSVLLRSETELKMTLEALTRMQRESTEMLERIRASKKRLEELEYVAHEAVSCDAMTGLCTNPPDVIRHLKSHIEDLAEVMRSGALPYD